MAPNPDLVRRRYWLDTNAYVKLFAGDVGEPRNRLVARLTNAGILSCTISVISSLEIHSVLGRHKRAQTILPIACERVPIGVDGGCPHKWQPRTLKPISRLLISELHKIIRDAENCRGQLQVTVAAIDPLALERARQFLEQHGAQIKVGSHDALIAGCFAIARDDGISDCLVTSDRGLKRLLCSVDLAHYDPESDVEWPP